MFGEIFTCSSCDFEFQSGWSHHQAGESLVCRECATAYFAGEGVSRWGAIPGERLKLFRGVYVKRRKREEYQATGAFLTVSQNRASKDSAVFLFFLEEDLRHLSCVTCGKSGSIVETLHVGDQCPKCKAGKIGEPDRCIY
ncbi:MAG: hypothetical protein ABJF10_15750 [Chthoniobacter sp.]|uniref:hypothetical protein n=1 Tax=Chthoniobacter sp. TaxID=2510640 RepID=UPI0032AD973D